jgi:hypothetical protein
MRRASRWEIQQVGLRRVDRPAPPPPPTSDTDRDYWWIDVLHDARTRWPSDRRLRADSRFVHLRVDRCHSDTLALICDLCGEHRTFAYVDIVKAFGRDYNTAQLRHELVKCQATGQDFVHGICHLRFAHW